MSSALPLIACLCPTFRRPTHLVANAVACFLSQTYPAELRKLFILDDSGELEETSGENWSIVSAQKRYQSLPEKYHALVEIAGCADAYCIWEDDECFLPRHIEGHAMALGSSRPWSHPFFAYALTTGEPILEETTGRFHSALAFTRDAYKISGGWPITKRPDFDLQLLANLRLQFGPPGNPCDFFDPTYVFRWGTTKSYHGQNFMNGQNEDWWDLAEQRVPEQGKGRRVIPKLDDETQLLYSRLGNQ